MYEESERIRIENNMCMLTDRCMYVAKGAIIVNGHSGNRFEILDILHYEYEERIRDVYMLKSLEKWNYGELSVLDIWELDGVWWYIENNKSAIRENTNFTF